jgi:uncharacterized protein (TIGR00251 family)
VDGRRTRLRLHVVPGAGRTGVVGRHGAAWKVRVTAPPERGRANDAVLELLSDTLSLPRASVSLVSGHGGRDKIVELAGITGAELESRLASAERKDVRR